MHFDKHTYKFIKIVDIFQALLSYYIIIIIIIIELFY